MKFVEIDGVTHLKIENSYYTLDRVKMLISIGEKTINAYETHNTSLPATTVESEVTTHAI
ncbi:MAG: hypothetical protein IJH65_12095 [Methanobrevibacter sp.]|nr:hypothetical protein [Methanobrevibacter sp.]